MMLRLSVSFFLGSAMQSCLGDPNADMHALWDQQLAARVARATERDYGALRDALVASESACDVATERGSASPSAMKLSVRCATGLPILRAALARTTEWSEVASAASAKLEEATRPTRACGYPFAMRKEKPHPVALPRECMIARRTAALSEESHSLAALCDENAKLPPAHGME